MSNAQTNVFAVMTFGSPGAPQVIPKTPHDHQKGPTNVQQMSNDDQNMLNKYQKHVKSCQNNVTTYCANNKRRTNIYPILTKQCRTMSSVSQNMLQCLLIIYGHPWVVRG